MRNVALTAGIVTFIAVMAFGAALVWRGLAATVTGHGSLSNATIVGLVLMGMATPPLFLFCGIASERAPGSSDDDADDDNDDDDEEV